MSAIPTLDTVTIVLDHTQYEDLHAKAQARGISVNEYVRAGALSLARIDQGPDQTPHA